MEQGSVVVLKKGPVTVIQINRPSVRNAVDTATARSLRAAFQSFDCDPNAKVAVLCGAGGNFCAGADLKAVAAGEPKPEVIPPEGNGHGPMGPTYMMLTKPVIAAVTGHAVAGGLELALWCDMRFADASCIFGVYCRRWGVPLVDGGTVRLPRTVGMANAMDMILTGRAVGAREALRMGLVSRVVPEGRSVVTEAVEVAQTMANFPQKCMLVDRASAYRSCTMNERMALAAELRGGIGVLAEESIPGARQFVAGRGRHGSFSSFSKL